MSGMIFGFCMARIVTTTMRLVWASYPRNVRVAIAAQVFVAAGVVLLFIINLIFAQRVLRASHPHFAWTKWFSWAFKIYYISIILGIGAVITVTIQSFYTLDRHILAQDNDVRLAISTFFAVTAFLPIPLILLRVILPRRVTHVQKFGGGRFRTKYGIIIFTSLILTLGAAFRAGTAYVPAPRDDPAWYDSKACFYCFNFVIEIIVVYLYAIMRVDKRFHIPDKAHKQEDYTKPVEDDPHRLEEGEKGDQDGGTAERRRSLMDRINTEEEFFDAEDRKETPKMGSKVVDRKSKDLGADLATDPALSTNPSPSTTVDEKKQLEKRAGESRLGDKETQETQPEEARSRVPSGIQHISVSRYDMNVPEGFVATDR